MKNIFFVINRLGGKGWGGAHRVMAILANYLSEKGYKVRIIVWENGKIDYPINAKIEIINLNVKLNKATGRLKACIKTRKALKAYTNITIFAFTSRIAVDVLLSTLFMKVSIIASERTDPNTEPKKLLFRKIRDFLFCFMDKTVYQTEDALKYFPKKAQKHGCVIFNPISPGLIKPYSGKRKKEFVTFCRIDKQKNLPLMIDSFIEAHKKHKDFYLKIYGTGLIEQEIRKYIKDKGAEEYIIMKGFSNDVHKKILKSYAYINSSDYEGMSNSMLEAMAIGLPCICTDCPIGGARSVIKNMENGLLVPIKNKERMTESINFLIEHENICKKLSSKAIEIREELEEKRICKEWENLID